MDTSSLPEGMHEFQNAYLHLVVDEATRLLYSEWVQRPNSEEYREAASIFAAYLRERDIKFWIQDTNRLGEVPAQNLKEALQMLVPVAVASGLKKLARITTDDRSMAAFMALASESKAQLKAGIEVRQFRTYREAAEWIWGTQPC
ncbi:hypothetical protein [Pontibacter harenae]|uniref:hypothetical protein n=1 Tax=Pontibacter harenae TaxID=2894083 RepID=UPI001E57253E|nr:hypothetical protein [Pontibacter harenae]MCC9169095.1 hypothetical protein [Pontibacter harenae]